MSERPEPRDEPIDPQLAQWYREADAPQPDEAIDRAILAAARREVSARPRLADAALRQWRVPLSIAAVLVLSVTVVTLVKEQGGAELDATRSAQSTAIPGKVTSDAQQRASVSAVPAPAPEQPPSAASVVPEPGKGETQRLAETSAARQDAGGAAKAAGAPPALLDAMAGRAPGASSAPAAPVPPRPEPAGELAKSADGGISFLKQVQSREARDEAPAASPSRAGPAAAPSMQAAPDVPPAARPPAPQAGAREERLQTRPAAALSGGEQAPETVQLVKSLEGQPPERWLARMEELRREGRSREADELLEVFRKRFPTHPAAAAR